MPTRFISAIAAALAFTDLPRVRWLISTRIFTTSPWAKSAFLTGIIRAPNRYASSDRHPERAAEARDRVLKQMVENGYITPQQERDAKRAPLQVVPGGFGNSDAPYFVDMVKDHLLDHFSEAQLLSQSFRIYTTLDPELERAATQAISIGVANVDKQLARRYARVAENRASRRWRRLL